MAGVFELSDAAALAFSRPKGEMRHYARRLREASMLPTSIRGAKPTSVSDSDIARFLIGIMASETATGAPAAVSDFGGLEVSEVFEGDAERMEVSKYRLFVKHTLLEVLTHLLKMAGGYQRWDTIRAIDFKLAPDPMVILQASAAILGKINSESAFLRFGGLGRIPTLVRETSIAWHFDPYCLGPIYGLTN